jgi:hypothetical protein
MKKASEPEFTFDAAVVVKTRGAQGRSTASPPMNVAPFHKMSLAQRGNGSPRSVCGRYGYVTPLWRNVTCLACAKQRR